MWGREHAIARPQQDTSRWTLMRHLLGAEFWGGGVHTNIKGSNSVG